VKFNKLLTEGKPKFNTEYSHRKVTLMCQEQGEDGNSSSMSRPSRLNDDTLPWESMSFACGGWLQFYLYGVGRALQARGLDYPNEVTYCGCSAGALGRYRNSSCSADFLAKLIPSLITLQLLLGLLSKEILMPQCSFVRMSVYLR
jgi:hypothetical protein